MEKLAFALVIASRKLRPYFQAHTIRVLTEYPLKKVLRKLDLSGRLANWAIELGEFDIEFLPRNSLKGQALADFPAEFTNLPDITSWPSNETWVIYVDGSSTKKHGGAEIVMITPDGEELCSSLKLKFKTTNNEAEYKAVLAGLGLALEIGAEFVEIRSDSQVVVGHIRGEFEAKGDKMKLYLSKVQDLQALFKKFSIVKISRPENEKADQLARIASTASKEIESETPIQILPQSSVTEAVSVSTAEIIPNWQLEIMEYLERGVLPSDRKLATRLKVRAERFTMINGVLYKRGFTLPLLKCVSKDEGDYILREIHEGVCGSHSGARILAHKAVRADIVGPLPRSRGGVRFAVVAVDYFTKWAEVEALVNITAKTIERFLWKNIICRYGIPHAFITDNGKQFDCDSFRAWCAQLRIRNYYSSPGHPQANGQAEDLPEVLCAYRTTKRIPNEETPYALAFGTEAVIPAEVGSGSYRVETFQSETNNEGLQLHLDFLQEKWDQAQVAMAAYQARVTRYLNKKVKPRSFKVGDMVLRKATLATKDPAEGKLAPNWEGYRVIECKRAGAYHLEDSKGKALSRPWNAEHLKKYYV
ncbi:uncharacterized protein LOC132177982 [Corylus avellana]|uniref:uncharacterized protein LOC132177982 n=1 Tax=Corylus avellana TaxID=13451 RepID=UPI00286D2DC6|nr:uncharacterized protein LOC132177982 [Corylus avellana]